MMFLARKRAPRNPFAPRAAGPRLRNTKAGCEAVWKLFSECEQWNRYVNAYGKIRWLGERWAPGSRLLIEMTCPTSAVQNRVITVCNPPRSVAWINHVLGYTMEQWVCFDPLAGGGTRISTWVEIAGPTLIVDGQDLVAIARNFVETWYNNFGKHCETLARDAGRGTLKSGSMRTILPAATPR
jgi:hypothetical protein